MTKYLKILLFALILGAAPMVWACCEDEDWEDTPSGDLSDKEASTQKIYGDYTESDKMKGVKTNICDVCYVDQNKARGKSSDGGTSSSSGDNEQSYLNNLDSTTENRNKLRLNAAVRAIALGQHAVALATASGKDVDEMKEEIESRDDILRMLKGIAKLQAQNLQKTNAITAMRAKIAELNAIESITAGNIYTTNPSSSSSNSSSSNSSASSQ